MEIFKKKCTHCRKKIEKGNEIKRNVKIPEFAGTHSKNFCSENHANLHEQEIKSKSEKSKKSCCCG